MGINVALNMPTTSSNCILPYSATMAVNGVIKPLQRWIARTPCWMRVDLKYPTWVNRWVVKQMGTVGWRYQDYNSNGFQLQGSNDDSNWVNVDIFSGTPTVALDRTFTPACFRFFRVYVSGLNINPKLASIVEFELYSAPPTSSLLSNLELSKGTMTPNFSSNTLMYAATVEYAVTSITVKPTAQDSNAIIQVNGVKVVSGQNSQDIPLAIGNNTVAIKVTPQIPGVVTNYSVTITRNDAPYLSNLVISNGALTPTFAPTTYAYTNFVDYSVQTITITPTAQNPSKIITVNGTVVTSGSVSLPITLNVGKNTILVAVKNQDGSIASSYSIEVTRGSSPYLTQIIVGGFAGAAKTINTEANKYEYTISVTSSATGVKVKPIAEDATATIKVNNTIVSSGSFSATIPITTGSNLIEINVTAASGSQQVLYKLTITK
ncbi:MAG: cadherin-like beta sandwich domain-containing protein [Cellulosilyticaceae bacterium]